MKTVLKVFMERCIPLEKLCCVAIDGVSVMVGCQTGVATQLKGKNPFFCVNSLYHILFGQP